MDLFKMKQEFLNGKTILDLPLRVVYYARVSTEKEEQLNSLENQIDYFENYIRQNSNWTYVRGYVDEGISGTTSKKRENFMKMITDAKNGEFDLIVTKEISRFSRDIIDSLSYTRLLLTYNVCVFFTSDNIITASSDGELRLTIMASIAQDEIRKLSERTKFGFQRSLEKGTVLGNDNIWGYKKDNGKLVIDENEAPMIREIFEKYANDSKIGLKKLSVFLTQKGYLNRNGNSLHQNTLKDIIQNPKYKGYYTGKISTVVDYRTKKRNYYDQSEWIVYKDFDNVPPIVAEELWNKANQKLSSRSKKAAKYQKYQTLYHLSGKLYCEKHECGFVRKVKHYKNKEDVIHWYCSNFHKTGSRHCNPASFKEADLYDILLSIFKSYEMYKDEICKELLELYMQTFKEEKNSEKEQTLQKQLEILNNRKENLLNLALDGLLSKEELQNRKLSIETQIEQIKAKLKEIEGKIKKPQEPNLKKYILNEFKINLGNLEDYIEELLDKIIVTENNLQIVLAGNKIINKPLCHFHAHS